MYSSIVVATSAALVIKDNKPVSDIDHQNHIVREWKQVKEASLAIDDLENLLLLALIL